MRATCKACGVEVVPDGERNDVDLMRKMTEHEAECEGLICEECGNDTAASGLRVCLDCAEELGDDAPTR